MSSNTTIGRQPLQIIELVQDFCSLTYGTSPCAAALGVAGSFKCYNTLPTCQDPTNYDRSSLTLRFCNKTSEFPKAGETDEQYIPMVTSVRTSPAELNISDGNTNLRALGKRATVTITMQDAPYNDAFVDPYISDRGFDPLSKSTFWAKWLARNKFYQNRLLRVREGYVGETVSSMRTKHYFIDKITGPDSNGKVTITGKDVLKLADDDRALAPVGNEGVLAADIDDLVTTAELDDANGYSTSGTLIIGSEVMTFTRSGTTLTLTRAQSNTTASSHSEGDPVQECLVYSNERIDSVVEDLLVTYGNIDPTYITTSDWTDEADEWLSSSFVNAVIVEPTGVNELLGELLDQYQCFIWWDEVNQQIRFQASRPVNQNSITDLNEDANIIQDSLAITRQPNQRVSRVLTYFDIINPTQGDNVTNFDRLNITIATEAESDDEYGEQRNRTVFSKWIDAANSFVATSYNSKKLLAFRDIPIYVTFDLDAKDRDLDLADVVRITHRSFVDSQGNEVETFLQVISRDEVESGHRIRYKCQIFGFIGRFGFIMPDTANDFDNATEDEKNTGGYISDDAGFMPDGSEAYKIS